MATLTAKPFSMLYSYIDNHVKAILMAQKKVNSQLPVALYLISGSHTPMNIGWFFKVKFPNFIFGGRGGGGYEKPGIRNDQMAKKCNSKQPLKSPRWAPVDDLKF